MRKNYSYHRSVGSPLGPPSYFVFLPIPMNKPLQAQLQELQRKIDHLQSLILEIRHQIGLDSLPRTKTDNGSPSLVSRKSQDISQGALADFAEESFDFSHKDVLLDGDEGHPFWTVSGGQSLSPDLQVRRLTAQLTAAYHRIAALEEQLLHKRKQS